MICNNLRRCINGLPCHCVGLGDIVSFTAGKRTAEHEIHALAHVDHREFNRAAFLLRDVHASYMLKASHVKIEPNGVVDGHIGKSGPEVGELP